MKKLAIIFILLGCSVLVVFSCKKKDPEPEPIPDPAPAPVACTPATVIVNTDVNTPTTWNACNIYIISPIQISVNSILTIEPGTIIKFKESVGDNSILVSNAGRIIAEGTADKPIVFTSYKDDARGGDSNGDGTATSPKRSDWGGIIVNSNTCTFKYCKFYFGGEGPAGGTNQPTLEFSYNYGIIDHCTFAHCGGETTYNGYGVVDARYSESPNMQITNSTFYDCIKPLFLNPHISVDNSNTFHNPSNVTEKNQLNGIFLTNTPNEPTTDVSWQETEVPFVLTGSFYLEDGKKLNLAPGVIIKMALLPAAGYNKISIKEGQSFIENNNASGVFFTSYLDDANGGDTNGDGNTTSPAKGDWYGVQDISGVITTSNSCYAWSNILYAKYP
jgi:hypothetical protein